MISSPFRHCLRQRIGSPSSSSASSEAAFSSTSLEPSASPGSVTSTASTPFRRSIDNGHPNMLSDAERPDQIVIGNPNAECVFKKATLQTDEVQKAKHMVTKLHPVPNKGKICRSIVGALLAKHCSSSLFGFHFPWWGLWIIYVLSLCGMHVVSTRIMAVASGKASTSSTGFCSLSSLERTFHSLAIGSDVLISGICAHVANHSESDVVEKVAIAVVVIVAFWPDSLTSGHDDGAGRSSATPGSNGQGLTNVGYGDDETQPSMASRQSDAGTFQDLEHGPTSV